MNAANNAFQPGQEETNTGRGSRPRYDAALSTMWTVNNYKSLAEMFTAADQMGFSRVELNHMIDSTLVDSLEIEKYPVTSVHEPCPADISTVELRLKDWLPSAPDEENRKLGVQAIQKSLDLAHRISKYNHQTMTIVMHCGQVQIDHNDEDSLRKLLKQGKKDTPEFRAIQARMIDERAERAGAYLSTLKKSVLELLEYAAPFNVRIGLENRFHYFDIPLQDEMEELLALADSSRLGYIYDVGHAQALDRMGFLEHEDWLKRFSSRMFGTHLHDVRGADDHWPPGMGEIDFTKIAGYLPADAFRTLEIHGRHTLEQVQNGLKVLEQAGCVSQISSP